MSQLQVGDTVLSITQDGRLSYSDVIAFLDTNHETVLKYYILTTQSGNSITLTGKHLIYATNFTSKLMFSAKYELRFQQLPQLTFAEDVKIGQFVFLVKHNLKFVKSMHGFVQLTNTTNSSNFLSSTHSSTHVQADDTMMLIPEKVVSIQTRSIRGVYAPLTLEGTIVVDDVATSCYAFVDHHLSHAVFSPLRGYHVIKTLFRDWLGSFVHYFDWLSTISCFFNTKRNETIFQHRENGVHLYARFLYKFAVNVCGMDIYISL